MFPYFNLLYPLNFINGTFYVLLNLPYTTSSL